jgi:PAS domain S-box-containing protein
VNSTHGAHATGGRTGGLRWLKALLAATIVMFAMAGAYTAVVILERQATLEDASHYDVSWPLSQAVNELSRFVQRAAMFSAKAGGVTADELQLRFDILLNRQRLLSDASIRQFIQSDPERAATFQVLVDSLAAIEPLVADLRGVDVAARIVAPLGGLESRLVGLASEAFRYEAELNADEARNLRRLHRLFSSLSGGLIFCGLGFLLIMLWQNRVIRKAHDNLQVMADDLQRTSVSHRFLDDIMNGMTEGLVVVDADGRIGMVNDTAERITGHRRDLLLGSPIAFLFDEDLPGELAAALAHVGAMRRADGTQLPVRISASHVAEGAMQGATICVFQDLTEQRRAEAEKSALREQLYDAQKMQAIGTLAGGIAHDFNNILGSILGYSFLALEDLPAGHPVRPALEQITTAGNRARDLVRQILAYSRNVVAELGAVELGAVLEASLAPLRLSLPPNVTLSRSGAEAATVSGNPTQLDQVIANVVLNAIHAIGSAPGTVRVSMDIVDSAGQAMAGLAGFKGRAISPSMTQHAPGTERAETWVGVLERRRYARIVIEDDGCGMTHTTMARIFEPFFTTKEVGKGTGLGLAAVHGILRTHAGVMHVESTPGAGSRFELYLPSTDAPRKADAVAAPTTPTRSGSERILVLDDDRSLLDLARLTLARLGYRVDAFAQAREALEVVAADPGAWDLVITDRTMPDMGGEAFARAVRGLRRDLPIIMMTGFADAADEARILRGGVDAILFKPLVGPDLVAVVRDALGPHDHERLIA